MDSPPIKELVEQEEKSSQLEIKYEQISEENQTHLEEDTDAYDIRRLDYETSNKDDIQPLQNGQCVTSERFEEKSLQEPMREPMKITESEIDEI
jgi:hypothetical protein